MKKSKWLFITLLIAAACFALAACAPFEDFDDDEVIAKKTSYSTVGPVENNIGNQYELTVKTFNGVKKIAKITAADANPVLDVTLTIEEGEFKVVLVKDNKVYTVCDKDTSEPVTCQVEAGTYTLKIVGRDAKVKFKVNY